MGLCVARGPEDNNVVKTVGGIQSRFFPIQSVGMLTQGRVDAFIFKDLAESRGIDLDRHFVERLDILVNESYGLDPITGIRIRNT